MINHPLSHTRDRFGSSHVVYLQNGCTQAQAWVPPGPAVFVSAESGGRELSVRAAGIQSDRGQSQILGLLWYQVPLN